MEENSYLIPANSKKSALILGLFTFTDIIVFSTGSLISLLALIIIGSTSDLLSMILIFSPAAITGILVMPFPNYHNLLNFFISLIGFYSNRRKYIWKGWQYRDQLKKY